MNRKIEQSKSIEETKREFEASFAIGSFYNKQTQDDKHLEMIIDILKIKPAMRILDLGTGTGYLAFPIAKKYPEAKIIGLDIVENTLKNNRERAEQDGIDNIQFVSYNGMEFPFENETFDIVVTRYALHHFPAINDTFQEISRVLKADGRLFLADPSPNDDDTERFVDAYMQMKKDGHIKFYTQEEWCTLGQAAGLAVVDSFETYIRFPRKKNTALEFDDIMNSYPKKVIESYKVEVIDDEIWITEKVNNILLKKQI